MISRATRTIGRYLRTAQLSDGTVRMLASICALATIMVTATLLMGGGFGEPEFLLFLLAVAASIIPLLAGVSARAALLLALLATTVVVLGGTQWTSSTGVLAGGLLGSVLLFVLAYATRATGRVSPVLLMMAGIGAGLSCPLVLLHFLHSETLQISKTLFMVALASSPFVAAPLLSQIESARVLRSSLLLTDLRVLLLRLTGSCAALLGGLSVARGTLAGLSAQLASTALEPLAEVAAWSAGACAAAGTLWLVWALPRRLAAGQLRGRYHPAACAEGQWFVVVTFFWALLMSMSGDPADPTLWGAMILGSVAYISVRIPLANPRSPGRSSQWIVLLHPPTRAARLVARRLAVRWRHGPTTLLSTPEAAAGTADAHTRLSAATGNLPRLFPARPAHLVDWDEGLPEAHVWHTLPLRELYAPAPLWPTIFTHRLAHHDRVLVVDSEGAGVYRIGPSQTVRLQPSLRAAQLADLDARPVTTFVGHTVLSRLEALIRRPDRRCVLILHTRAHGDAAWELRKALDGYSDQWGYVLEPWVLTVDGPIFARLPPGFSTRWLSLYGRGLVAAWGSARAKSRFLSALLRLNGLRPDDQYDVIVLEPEADLLPSSTALLSSFERLISHRVFNRVVRLRTNALRAHGHSIIDSRIPGTQAVWNTGATRQAGLENVRALLLALPAQERATADETPESIVEAAETTSSRAATDPPLAAEQPPRDQTVSSEESESATRNFAELYSAAVGEAKASYYVPKFMRFDRKGASRRSWNWPAFFVTLPWMLYRRMYALAILYFIGVPLSASVVGTALALRFNEAAWLTQTDAVVYVYVALAFVLTPMYANSLYHRHVAKRIVAAGRGASSHEVIVNRLLGQPSSSRAWPVTAVVVTFVAGVLAQIAIPAYQDYTVRSQVSEGLMLASPVQAMVAESYLSTNRWPDTLEAADAGAAEISGTYVESISVVAGVVLIRYGRDADSAIAGKTLALRPSLREDGTITWACGYNGLTNKAAAVRQDATIEQRYLPMSCRATSPPAAARNSFRKVGDQWIEYPEYAPGRNFIFEELSRDSQYIYLADRSRPKDGNPSFPMLVRVPIRGGLAQWSYDPSSWTDLFVVDAPEG